MTFEFHWKNKEANFGSPAEKEIDGGTHFTIEIFLKHRNNFVMVRRPKSYPGHQLPPKAGNYPNGCLYFCHDLPRWGESLDEAVKRIVRSQIAADIKTLNILNLDMTKYPDEMHEGNKQWAITLFVIAELAQLPKLSKDVTEIVQFDISNIPDDMGWWEKEELEKFLRKYNRPGS